MKQQKKGADTLCFELEEIEMALNCHDHFTVLDTFVALNGQNLKYIEEIKRLQTQITELENTCSQLTLENDVLNSQKDILTSGMDKVRAGVDLLQQQNEALKNVNKNLLAKNKALVHRNEILSDSLKSQGTQIALLQDGLTHARLQRDNAEYKAKQNKGLSK